MKRNKMMRIAAVLLVVTLLSTVAISGTFAKYVTKAAADDSARVAKWGVVVTTESGLFSDTYEAEDADYVAAGGTLSVDAADDKNVVAPGTKGDGFTANISGKPEVATRFALKVYLSDLEDVLLPVGEGYTDLSGIAPDGTFDLPTPDNAYLARFFKGYAPVKWDAKITRVKDDGSDGNSISLTEAAAIALAQARDYAPLAPLVVDGVSLTDAKTIVNQVAGSDNLKNMINTMINTQFASTGAKNVQVNAIYDPVKGEGFEISMDFDANSNLNYRIEAGWSWDFDDNGAGTYDVFDTYLGNVAAGVVPANGATTNIKFKVEASATQID